MLKKLLLALILWLVPFSPCSPIQARPFQVPILRKHRVYNQTRCQCVWASLECLGRHHGIPSTYDLTQCYHGFCPDPNQALTVLRQRNIQGYMLYPGVQNTKFLQHCCAKGWGACVGLGYKHVVVIVHYKDGEVGFIDNNDSDLQVKMCTEQEFLRHWDGFAITLYPPTPLVPKK